MSFFVEKPGTRFQGESRSSLQIQFLGLYLRKLMFTRNEMHMPKKKKIQGCWVPRFRSINVSHYNNLDG